MVRSSLACTVALMLFAGATAASAGAATGDPPAPAAGTVRFVKGAESAFDVYTRSPTAAQQWFMGGHYWRLRAYSPYFDSRLVWAPEAWVYQNAYAIHPAWPTATEHPDWILRDGFGNKLWIPFACSNGSCTQYAADVGNPAFREWWIASAKLKLAAGYRGLFIDDVNMARRVSNGDGQYTQPIDPRTGTPMDLAAWQRYMAGFTAQVRAALPGVEIVHNALWPVGDGTADLQRQLTSADYIEIERGFNDPGIVGGSSKFGFDTLLRFIDRRHAAGTGVILDGYADTSPGRLYGLATYFLISSGIDALGNDAFGTPDNWWSAGYDVHLGAPAGPRYLSSGMWRRDFANGIVLVNEPGATTRTVAVGAGYEDLERVARSSVTLGPASGAVLLRR
jgi:Hypothetical glycosyl hydrolase family 15